MALDVDLTRFAAQSARTLFSAMSLVNVTGSLVSCYSPQYRDATERLFVALDRPPLTSDRASTGGVSFTDYDGDGDPDILFGNWPNQPGEGFEENTLIENRFADGNSIRVLLEGTASNRSAIGALIRVETIIDGRTVTQVREVSAHSGWRSQGELTQHFGLGTETAVSRIVIEWPSGHSQTIAGPPINEVLRAREAR